MLTSVDDTSEDMSLSEREFVRAEPSRYEPEGVWTERECGRTERSGGRTGVSVSREDRR